MSTQENTIVWELAYHSAEKPLFLLQPQYYTTKPPAAKSLVGAPLANYSGSLVVNGETITVDNWTGSQNHNWGSKHTDLYSWGQVAGFDAYPESFFEMATARLKLASCTLRLKHKQKHTEETLSTLNRAAFEILTDDQHHGLQIQA